MPALSRSKPSTGSRLGKLQSHDEHHHRARERGGVDDQARRGDPRSPGADTMNKAFQDLIDFHRACDEPAYSAPAIPPADRVQLRRDLLREEYEELERAVEAEDLVEIADGLVDMIYVATGTALEYGIDLPAVWDEIHASMLIRFLHTGARC